MGTNDEKKEIEAICADNSLAVNFCNKSALLDIPQIAEGALAVVGNDTGPQHMAELSGVPAITLFAKITAFAACKEMHITNLVGEKIEDISVDEVACKLQFLWHKP
jgi:ADP-heptose:LPS heptosyltransferase